MTQQTTSPDLPWDWIGPQGSGQRPMTQTQCDWLKRHGMTREEYMRAVRQPDDEK